VSRIDTRGDWATSQMECSSQIVIFGDSGSSDPGGGGSGAGGSDVWKASEELALLEAVEVYGFGNWEDTAKLVGNRRTPEEVKRHFITYYVQGNVGRVCWASASPETYESKDHTCSGSTSSLSPSLTTPLPAIPELTLSEQQHLGYMPKRDDFEREFDNEVEALISTLRISPNDEDELDVDLKVAHIDMYNRRLRERFRKKAVVRDYGLVSLFYKSLQGDEEIMAMLYPPQSSLESSTISNSKTTTSLCATTLASHGPNQSTRLQSSHSPSSPMFGVEKSSSSLFTCSNKSTLNGSTASPSKKRCGSPTKNASVPEFSAQNNNLPITTTCTAGNAAAEKYREQLKEKLKILSQFQSALEQQQLLDSLKKEKELKMRIKELVRYRKNGLKKLSDMSAFDSARVRKDKKKENKEARDKGGKVANINYALKGRSQMVVGGKAGKMASPSMVSSRGSTVKRPASRDSLDNEVGSMDSSSKVTTRLTGQQEKQVTTGGRSPHPTKRRVPLVLLTEEEEMQMQAEDSNYQTLLRSPSTSPSYKTRTASATATRGSPPAVRDSNSSNLAPTAVGVTKSLKGDVIITTTSLGDNTVKTQSRGLKEFDVNSMPSARLLSDQEKHLCSTLRLTPSQYISIKGLMIREKSLPKKQRTGLENLDGRVKRRLRQYFSRNGWIRG